MADFEMSIWKNVADAGYKADRQSMTVYSFIDIIKSDKYKVVAEAIRAEPDKDRRNILKTALPSATVSGVFRERKKDGLLKHSGLICMDFDKLGDKVAQYKEALRKDKHTLAIFTSVSGAGLAVIVQIDPLKHLETFEALEKYYYEQYSLVADTGTKDICRLRFFSHDPDAHINPQAEPFLKLPKLDKKPKKHYPYIPSTKTDIGKIVQQAAQKGIDITDGSYTEWIRLAASLATLGESGRGYFHALSQYSCKYNHQQCDKKFDNLLKTAVGNITIGTFYYFAKRAGLDTNTEKSKRIVEVCRNIKRISGKTADDAIKQLKTKNVICSEESEEGREDVALVQEVFEKTDVSETDGILEIEEYILENYEFMRNEISSEIEWKNGASFEDKDYSEIYLNTKAQFPKTSKNDVCDIIHARAKSYNPLKDYIENNRHHIDAKSNLIKELADTIVSDSGITGDTFDTEYEYYFIKKWLIGMIASIYGNVSPLLLALTGRQNTGKTQFLRRLLPNDLRQYMAQYRLGIDKYSQFAMTKYLIVLDYELSGKSRLEEKHLKEITSTDYFTFRPPYGRTSITRKRLAVLCGTTNDDAILGDITGNRRIIPIKVISVHYEQYNAIDKTKLFMEAVRCYEAGESWELSAEDIQRLNKNTVEHVVENYERDLLHIYFRHSLPDDDINDIEFLTATEIKNYIDGKGIERVNLRKLGMELRVAKFEREKKNGVYGYLVVKNNNTPDYTQKKTW